MKKDLLVYPYKFTNFEFYKFELDKFKYNIKLDLSFSNKKFRNSWKSSNFRKNYSPKNFYQLVMLKNELFKNDPIVLNLNGDEKNLWTTYVKFLIKKKNLKEIIIKDADIWGVEIKKNLKWFFSRILEHKLNFDLYFYYLSFFFYKTIFYFLKHRKEFIFSLNGTDEKYIHNFDYSNSIDFKKTKGKKKYAIYLDNGGPYFKGDANPRL